MDVCVASRCSLAEGNSAHCFIVPVCCGILQREWEKRQVGAGVATGGGGGGRRGGSD